MEGTTLAEPEVRKLLKEFVVAKLYTDPDPANDANVKLQRERFSAALPLYVTIGPDDVVRSSHEGLASKELFIQFLKKGLEPRNGSK